MAIGNANVRRPQGIQAGFCYIRKPGPESAPAISEEDWSPLIRRCLLNDRDGLFRDFEYLLRSPAKSGPSDAERINEWHAASDQRFRQALAVAPHFHWPTDLKENRYQLSYMMVTADGDTIPESLLLRLLEEINNEVRDTVWTGWSMFYPFSRSEIAPAFHPENPDGSGPDVLEVNLIGDGTFDMSLPDFWRVSSDGRATLVRAYREDRQRSSDETSRQPGTWLSPVTVLRETAEVVTHAKLMARRSNLATGVRFRCTWRGLKGRDLQDFSPDFYWGSNHGAKADLRVVGGEWSVSKIVADWQTIVSDLGCPVLRLFGFHDCGPTFVRRIAPRFRIS